MPFAGVLSCHICFTSWWNPFFLFHQEFLRGQLHDRMAQDLVLRNLSPSTARNYLLYGRKFAAFFALSPAELGEAEVRQFLLHCIAVQKKLSYDSYRQIYAACSGGMYAAVPNAVPARDNPAACSTHGVVSISVPGCSGSRSGRESSLASPQSMTRTAANVSMFRAELKLQ